MTKTILYIEDNSANLRLVEQIVKRKTGFKFVPARDAMQGLELAQQYKPDLILMDINLPGMDGYDALNQLKMSEDTRDIPVVAVSASAMESDLIKGETAGFKKYLTKPVNIHLLLETIEELIVTNTPRGSQ